MRGKQARFVKALPYERHGTLQSHLLFTALGPTGSTLESTQGHLTAQQQPRTLDWCRQFVAHPEISNGHLLNVPWMKLEKFVDVICKHLGLVDYLPQHFSLSFIHPSCIYIRACCIIDIFFICSLYHSVQKSTINNLFVQYWFKIFHLKILIRQLIGPLDSTGGGIVPNFV